jgi:hypothetical protein
MPSVGRARLIGIGGSSRLRPCNTSPACGSAPGGSRSKGHVSRGNAKRVEVFNREDTIQSSFAMPPPVSRASRHEGG